MAWKSFSFGVLVAVLAASPASAAEGTAQLTGATGRVLVNQGAGYQEASGGMFLKPGDSIFSGDGASAAITYVADNCQVAVPSMGVLKIEDLSPCRNKAADIHPTADVADIPEDAQASVPDDSSSVTPAVLLGGAAAAAAIVFLIKASDDDDDGVSSD